MTNRQWRVVFGTVNAICAFLLIQQPVQDSQFLAIGLGAVVAALGYLRAPDDIE